MDVLSAIEGRRSIRKYSPKKVEDEKLKKVLEAARLSPSARNTQDCKFIVVKDPDKIKKIGDTTPTSQFLAEAPYVIVACGTDPQSIMRCGQLRHTVDLSIATAYLILEAYEQGLGTCWIGSYDEQKVKEILNIPEGVRVVTLTPLGYPAEIPDKNSRKDMEEIVCYDTYK